jgi:hypothetical protein
VRTVHVHRRCRAATDNICTNRTTCYMESACPYRRSIAMLTQHVNAGEMLSYWGEEFRNRDSACPCVCGAVLWAVLYMTVQVQCRYMNSACTCRCCAAIWGAHVPGRRKAAV